ncbi:hypothetical protein KAR91_60830 [Candidatus Pacearchaeota archaeon]|nr:hypothetical protein [Candidatus Pacearchaeota archaeon]
MATYLNGYTLLEKLWIQLVGYNSNIASYVNGTDTTGAYSNAQIMDGINEAQRFLYNTLMTRIPYEFEEEISLTGVASVYTLPANFGRLRFFKDVRGYQIHPIKTDQRRVADGSGSKQLYYRKGNTLVRDRAGIVENCTLIYYRKPRDIEQGKATGGGAASITFATSAKKITDYYNGLIIENITKDWIDTITDYTTGRVATIAETAATDDYYGTVSDIPEPFHFLIIPRAVFEVTGNYPIVKEKPNVSGVELFNQDFLATLRAYAGEALDEYVEDTWCDYDSGGIGYGYGGIIPGH